MLNELVHHPSRQGDETPLRRYVVGAVLLITALSVVIVRSRSAVAQQALTACGTLNLANTAYTLQNDVRTDGSCFTISASGITLDLNGRAVTYDDFPGTGLPNAGFESGTAEVPSDWDLSRIPSARRRSTANFAMVGQWFLAFENASPGEELVSRWTQLPASSRAMVSYINGVPTWQWQVPPAVTLTVEFQDGSTVFTTPTNLGVQTYTFTTRATAGQYRLHLRIDTTPSGSQYDRPFSIDQLDLRPTGNYGVVINRTATVRNGRVIQGRGSGTFSHGISVSGLASGTVIDGLTIDTSGMIAMTIFGSGMSNLEIARSTLTGRSPSIFRRQDLENAITLHQGTSNRIHDNTITAGPGFGCIASIGGSGHEIYNNTCHTSSSITNHYGIIVYSAANVRTYNNTVNATHGQGIGYSTGFPGAEIFGNVINLNGTAPNVEYGVIGFDAIRLNDYGNVGLSENVSVRDNTITIAGGLNPFYLPGYDGYQPDGKVINGIMNLVSSRNVRFESNTITVRLSDPDVIGSCWEIGDSIEPGSTVWANNVCESNNKNVVIGGYPPTTQNALFRSNTLRLLEPVSGAYHTLFTRRTNADINSVRFLDTRLENGASFDRVYLLTYLPPAEYDFTVEWYLHLTVRDLNGQPIANANVEVRDVTGTVVFTGTTNTAGQLSNIELVQYQRYGPANDATFVGRRDRTPHRLTINASSFQPLAQTITMDGTKSIAFQLTPVGQTPPACSPQWLCTDWSACTEGVQTRTCTDLNACGTDQGRPSERQTCIVANTYYVATNGSDTAGDGSATRPWASIGHAVTTVPDTGATITVRDGNYGRLSITRRFVNPTTIRAQNPYRAVIRDTNNSLNVVEILGASNLVLEGLEIMRPPPYQSLASGAHLIRIDDNTGTASDNLTLRNNIIHDNYRNDLLKITGTARFITVSGNIFYNQPGVGDEHIDSTILADLTISDNIFFNDFTGSARAGVNSTHPFIVLRNSELQQSRLHRFRVQRNIFLNWEGPPDQAFLLLGENGQPYYEAEDITIENNLLVGNSTNPIAAAVNYKGARNITFRANTVVGDFPLSFADPEGAFAIRINREGQNPINTDLFFFNNIWSDPTGTMGRFSNIPTGDGQNLSVSNNLYWNGGNPVPTNDPLFNHTLDPRARIGDPRLGSQTTVVLPRWSPATGRFVSDNRTQREEFFRLVGLYGMPGEGSASIDAADPLNMPRDDILGNPRTGRGASPDLGAFETTAFAPPPICTPDWQCDETWSQCVNGVQTRQCTDRNQCGQDPPASLIRRSCDEAAPGAATDLRAN